MVIVGIVIVMVVIVVAVSAGMTILPILLPLLIIAPAASPQVLDGGSAFIGPVATIPAAPGLSLGGGRPSQFALGLNPIDAYAACGPAAAIAFGRWWGVDLSIGQVMSVATRGLWDANSGMYGVAAEQQLLARLNLPSRLEPINWANVTAEAAAGRPVILDTPGHYYFVDGVRTNVNGIPVYRVGTSGTDLRGGSDWMTAGQINGMAISRGNVRAAIFADTSPPSAPKPGTPS